MNRCERIGVMLDAYHDQELGIVHRWRVGRHLARCEDCRRELDALSRVGPFVREALASDGRDAREPQLWAELALRLPAGPAARADTLGSPRWDFALPAGAGALVAAALAGVLLWNVGVVPTVAPPEGVVRSLNAHGRPVMVLDGAADQSTIIWLMDDAAAKGPEEAASVWI